MLAAVPRNPGKILTRAATPALAELAAVLDDVAAELEEGDLERAAPACAGSTSWRPGAARPCGWPRRRCVSRRSRTGSSTRFAPARPGVRGLERALDEGSGAAAVREAARRAAREAKRSFEDETGFAIGVLVGQVRSIAADLLRALGLERHGRPVARGGRAGAGIMPRRSRPDDDENDDVTAHRLARPFAVRAPRPRRRVDGAAPSLLAVCAIVSLLVLLPVVVTAIQAFQGGVSAVRDVLRASSSIGLLKNTLLVTAISVPICGLFGVAGAWFVERTRLPARRLWAVLLVAPLTVPPFVTSYAWANLGNPFQGLYGAAGIIGFTYFPIVFLLVAVALRGLDPALEETAQSLGLGTTRIFFRVILPQLRPALLGGLLLVALDTLIEFDAFVALKFKTFSADIYAQYQLGFSASGAAALSFFSILICVLLLFGEAWLRGNRNYTRVSQGARRATIRYPLGPWTLPALGGLGAVVAVGVGIPVVTLIKWFATSSHAGLKSASANLQYLLPASLTSIGLGVGAALLAVVCALPVAVLAVRHRGPGVTTLERSVYLAFALPDLVAGIALAYAASHYASFLYGSFFLLVFAEAILFLPFALVALRASLGQIERSLEDSARSLGAGPVAALWRVTAPIARPGFLAAAVLVFAFTLGDLSTAQVLLPLNLYTLGTEFQANSSSVAFAAAAPFAAVLIALAMIAAYILMSRFGEVRALAED